VFFYKYFIFTWQNKPGIIRFRWVNKKSWHFSPKSIDILL